MVCEEMDAHIGEASHPGPKRIVKPKRARDRHVNQQPSAEHAAQVANTSVTNTAEHAAQVANTAEHAAAQEVHTSSTLHHDKSRETAYGMRADAHIGEASHRGPVQAEMNGRFGAGKQSITACLFISVACVLSVCDGMGCGLTALRMNDASLNRYIACEISEDAKRIAKNVNPDIDKGSNIDHSWHSIIFNIAEEDIKALGNDSIKMYLAGPPCQDFSKLRLIVKKSAKKKAAELRPGLNGPNGRCFRQVMQIWEWIKKYNPSYEFMIECVLFDDMKDDWKEVCDTFGNPMVINAERYSYTHRVRAY